MPQILAERRDLFPGGGAREIDGESQPHAARPFTADAVPIQARHFVGVIVREVPRVQAQQPPINTFTEGGFAHRLSP